MLNGDGRQPVTNAFPWSIFIVPIASALVLLGIAARWRVNAQRAERRESNAVSQLRH